MGQLLSQPSDGAAAPAATPCPRCQSPLADPTGLGWCSKCGYCRSLEEGQAVAAVRAPAAPAGPSPLAQTAGMVAGLPPYVWLTLLNAAAVAAASYYVGRYVELTALQRAVWTTVQILSGLGVMFSGQFMALIMIAPEDTTLGLKDAFLPFHLYGLVGKHLPRTRWPLYLGCCGAVLIVAAVTLIGGLGHWQKYLPSNNNRSSAARY